MDITEQVKADLYRYTNPSKQTGIGTILWYGISYILVISVIIWIIYSISNAHDRKRIMDYLHSQMQHLFASSRSSHHEESTASSAPVVHSSMNDHNNIEQSTQTINTALNYSAPVISHPDVPFQNDFPDSTIQSGRHSRMSTFGWPISPDTNDTSSELSTA